MPACAESGIARSWAARRKGGLCAQVPSAAIVLGWFRRGSRGLDARIPLERPPRARSTLPTMSTRRRPGALALTAWLALMLAPRGAQAQVRELRWDPPVDVTLTLVGGALWLASVALQPELAPRACRWCAANALDDGVRGKLLWSDPSVAGEASDVTAFALVPAATLGLDALAASHDRAPGTSGLDAFLVLEATVLALDVNQVVKLLVARERPYAQARPPDENGRRRHTDDDDVSFFSGHTTEAFALTAATGTVATMRGYRWAAAPWVVGGVLAAGTGYLRIAADRHWLSDVLVGMLVGVGIGLAVPLVFHAREPSSSFAEGSP
jgi:membrane-associated phospholipid phosphatase